MDNDNNDNIAVDGGNIDTNNNFDILFEILDGGTGAASSVFKKQELTAQHQNNASNNSIHHEPQKVLQQHPTCVPQLTQDLISSFSFHCIICFETFNHTVRYPVVLPCGHTCVCHPCAKRLTRCMECRTKLTFLPPPPTSKMATTTATTSTRTTTTTIMVSDGGVTCPSSPTALALAASNAAVAAHDASTAAAAAAISPTTAAAVSAATTAAAINSTPSMRNRSPYRGRLNSSSRNDAAASRRDDFRLAGASSSPHHFKKKPPPEKPIPLPLPKNEVLLTLMDMSLQEHRAKPSNIATKKSSKNKKRRKKKNKSKIHSDDKHNSANYDFDAPSSSGIDLLYTDDDTDTTSTSDTDDDDVPYESNSGDDYNSANDDDDDDDDDDFMGGMMMIGGNSNHFDAISTSMSVHLDEENEEEDIRIGLQSMMSTCGTYVVRAKEGLRVHLERTRVTGNSPLTLLTSSSEDENDTEDEGLEIGDDDNVDADADVDALVSCFNANKFNDKNETTAVNNQNVNNSNIFQNTPENNYLFSQEQKPQEESDIFQKHGQQHLVTASATQWSEEEAEIHKTSEQDSPQIQHGDLLEYGTHVQVVYVDDEGWAVLARKHGFLHLAGEGCGDSIDVVFNAAVVASNAQEDESKIHYSDHNVTSSHSTHGAATKVNDRSTLVKLVKIGPPLDLACQIESMLHDITERRSNLRLAKQEFVRLERTLKSDLKIAMNMKEDPNCLVVTRRSVLAAAAAAKNNNEGARTPIPSPRNHNTTTNPMHTPPRSGGSAGISHIHSTSTHHNHTVNSRSPAGIFIPASPIPERIDFRTGLSGHMGLGSLKASATVHAHPVRNPVRMMSDHKGVGLTKRQHTTGRSSAMG